MHGTAAWRVWFGWFKVPFTLFATGMMLLSVIGMAAIAPVDGVPAQAASPAAISPPNKDAYIFNTLSLDSSYLDAELTAYEDLHSMGYHVKTYIGTEGVNNKPGAANLKNFMSMATGGVVLILSHAGDTGIPIEIYGPCREYQTTGYPCKPSSGSYHDPAYDSAYKAFKIYEALYGDAVSLSAASYPNGGGLLHWVIQVNPSGLTTFFPHKIGIVVVAGCDSQALASRFTTSSFFGYGNLSCTQIGGHDVQTLFDDLAGKNGPNQRTTTSAQGFLPLGFGLAPGAVPVTLSPAVTSVIPSAGSYIGSGSPSPGGRAMTKMGEGRATNVNSAKSTDAQVPGSVQFDTQMDTSNDPNKAIKVSGCSGATIEKNSASWADDGSSLSFNILVPQNATGTATLTVNDHKAESMSDDGEGPNDFLDGNQSPSPASGEAPNDSDYVWTVSCTVICITASGMGSSCGNANSPPGLACVDTGCPTGAINVTVTEPGETAPFTISACCTQNSVILSPSSSAGPNATFTLTNPMYGPSPGCGVVFYFTDTRTNLNLGAAVSIQYCS